MKKIISSTFLSWLPLSVAIVSIYGIMYLAIQQYIRLSANELPLQYAYDIKAKIESGTPPPAAVTGISPIDLKKSLSPFVFIYDGNGSRAAGTASLSGKNVELPAGVLDGIGGEEIKRITWQPEQGVRQAIVVINYTLPGGGRPGHIVAGRSLQETETREHFVLMQILAGIFITIIATFTVACFSQFIRCRTTK